MTCFITFILSTPVGIIIGASITEMGGSLAITILQSIAGGTFIYLACCDFIIKEFHSSDDAAKNDPRSEEEKTKTIKIIACIKFCFILLGCVIIAALMSLGPKHEH